MNDSTSVFVGDFKANDLPHAAQERKRFQITVANGRI